MAKAEHNPKAGAETRAHILQAALKHFADAGYAATSVQQIVGDAKVSKPSLYYHFRDKAGLFEALVNEAHDGRFRVVQNAAAKSEDIRSQLREVLVALFDYFHKNRELTRIAFSNSSTRSSNARRRRANWTIILTVGSLPMAFTARRIFTSRRICSCQTFARTARPPSAWWNYFWPARAQKSEIANLKTTEKR
jgi:AcrR family transcriptional regulator